MSWNYRVSIEPQENPEPWEPTHSAVIREVYYNDDGVVQGHTDALDYGCDADTAEEALHELKSMLEAKLHAVNDVIELREKLFETPDEK